MKHRWDINKRLLAFAEQAKAAGLDASVIDEGADEIDALRIRVSILLETLERVSRETADIAEAHRKDFGGGPIEKVMQRALERSVKFVG